MSNKFLYFIFLNVIFVFHHNQLKNYQRKDEKIVKTKSDTVKSSNKLLSKKCYSISKGYYHRFGQVISNFYETSETLGIDLNNDNRIDTLVILTPLTLIPTAEKGGVCWKKNINESRLLLKVLNLKSGQKLNRIYRNIITNVSSFAWGGCEKISKIKDGFVLSGSRGQGCIFDYKIHVLNNRQKLYIKKIEFYSSCSKKSKLKIDYKNCSFPIEKYNTNIIEYLKNKNDM